MSDINISVCNNTVEVIIDGYYYGASRIPKEFNDCDESVLVGAVSDSIKTAINNAKKAMWPKDGDIYYIPDVLALEKYRMYSWDGHSMDKWLKAQHLVYRTKEEAIEAAKKMLEVVK